MWWLSAKGRSKVQDPPKTKTQTQADAESNP